MTCASGVAGEEVFCGCVGSCFAKVGQPIVPLLPHTQVLTKKKLQDLVREVDPNEQLDEDVEEVGTNP